MSFSSINIQGNIISSEILDKIRNEDIKFQSSAEFGLAKNTSIRDEIGIAWAAARAHYTAFKLRVDRLIEDETGTSETRNSWILPLLRELGYDVEKANAFVHPDTQKTYAISHQVANCGGFPIHVMGINDNLDKRRENGGPRLSPHSLLQEYLNHTDHTYGLVTNGQFLRLLRDATRLVRISYLEFDLLKMMEDDLFSDFAILFRLLHVSRLPRTADDTVECKLEYYHQESLSSGSRIREELSKAVERSIKQLANGFLNHPKNEELHSLIQSNQLSPQIFYQNQLRLIYRILFLAVTEERNLIYPETKDTEILRRKKIYNEFYSIERLRRLAGRLPYVDGTKHDIWENLKSTFLLFEKGFYGQSLGIAPLGSGLFGLEALSEINNLYLSNDTLLQVIRNLTYFENKQRQWVRVNYSDLDVEEFGSVYEGLLELEPYFHEIVGKLIFDFKPGSGRSKDGAHYTPEELVKPLIKHSLEYVIEEKLKETHPEQALLNITVCDIACGSGHILLSAARRIALELARVRTKADQPAPSDMRLAMRDVIRRCIHGVDKNEMAVELCKVALWLEAHVPGEPLNFLDHRIKCGDAIVGLASRKDLDSGIPDEAFKTLTLDEKEVSKSFRDKNIKERKTRHGNGGLQLTAEFDKTTETSLQEAMLEFSQFNNLPENNPDEIVAKSEAYKRFLNGKGFNFIKAMADTKIAQFFIPKRIENKDYLITDADFRRILSGYQGWQDRKVAKATVVGFENRFFHWFLEFPEVFNQGGFDCVLGNPPFLGGQKLSGNFGDPFLECVKYLYSPIGAVDLVTYFFRRIFSILKEGGFQSLISTNTIAQGKAREFGLDIICASGGTINHAIRSMPWPGVAAVEVSLISIHKGPWKGDKVLDSKSVDRITPYLDDSEVLGNPRPIPANYGKSFQGSIVLGKGFILTSETARSLISTNKENSKVILPYLNGDDINSHPEQLPSRWVINFFDWPEEKARSFPECFDIIERLVKPERQRWKLDNTGEEIVGEYALRKPLPEKWWIYGEKRPALYRAISKLDQVIVVPLVSKYSAFELVPSNYVFMHKLGVIASNDFDLLGILNSSIHNCWCWKYSSTLGAGTLNYSTSLCFETFPFPETRNRELIIEASKKYHSTRKRLLNATQSGLTKTLNLLHARDLSEIQIIQDLRVDQPKSSLIFKLTCELRDSLKSLDQEIVKAYGWDDLQLEHSFYEQEYLPEKDRVRYTISRNDRKEILRRLLSLNQSLS